LDLARQGILGVAERAEVLAESLDLTRSDAPARFVTGTVRAYGRLDVLVNNAGSAPRGLFGTLTRRDFDAAIALNVAAVFETARAAWPVMKDQGSGVIINISSRAASDPLAGFSIYGGCKAWVDTFSKALGDEGRALGIAVFSVRLGAVETPLLRRVLPDFPRQQTLQPDEVAEFVWRLSHPEMRFATGQAIGYWK
jgi:3-oxoacyl-[acyl-carrier protein] reductase